MEINGERTVFFNLVDFSIYILLIFFTYWPVGGRTQPAFFLTQSHEFLI